MAEISHAKGIGIGVLGSAILAGLPLITYYEKRGADKASFSEQINALKGRVKAVEEKNKALTTDLKEAEDAAKRDVEEAEIQAKQELSSASRVLHERVSDLDRDTDMEFEKARNALFREVADLEGQIWTVEQDVKRIDKTTAVIQATGK